MNSASRDPSPRRRRTKDTILSEKRTSRGKSTPGQAPRGPDKALGGGKAVGGEGPMNVALLESLVKLMSEHDLNTIDVRDGVKRVVLKRGAAPSTAPVYLSAPSVPQAVPVAPATAPAAPAEDADLLAIKSPMVGTFYTAASPDAKPFVQVGSMIDEETDVCIIEAMKVFNNIKAEVRGRIAKALVANGQTVEFGQTLFLVKPS